MPRLDTRWVWVRVALLAVAAFVVSVAAPAPVAASSGSGYAGLVPSSGPPADTRAAQAWASRLLERMSLDEKIGQLFVTYAYGDRVDTDNPVDVANNRTVHGVDNAAELIEKYHLGGIIYFNRFNNVNNPRQIAELSNGIQRVAAAQRQSIPMLISTDQEQGLVARVGPPATQFPGNMALGAARSARDAYDAARITGKELRAIGINQNLAPVADVNVNALNPVIGVRSFAENTELVSQLTATQVEGYQDGDVAATAKHFPGHGDTTVDSHTGIPVIDHSRQEWKRIDMAPFRAAIERGVDSIMTAHIVVPALDPSGDPATLSEPILTGLLRTELGYDGVVLTDALDMAGVREKYGDDRVPVLALKAGVDQLLVPPNLDLAYHAVRAAVGSGEISERRIDESVHRILRLKFQLGLFHDPYADLDAIDGVVGTPEHLARAQQAADQTTTLIKDDADLIPLAESPHSVLVTGWGATTMSTLTARISARGIGDEERVRFEIHVRSEVDCGFGLFVPPRARCPRHRAHHRSWWHRCSRRARARRGSGRAPRRHRCRRDHVAVSGNRRPAGAPAAAGDFGGPAAHHCHRPPGWWAMPWSLFPPGNGPRIRLGEPRAPDHTAASLAYSTSSTSRPVEGPR